MGNASLTNSTMTSTRARSMSVVEVDHVKSIWMSEYGGLGPAPMTGFSIDPNCGTKSI